MPHFILTCQDGEDGGARRAATRPAHLDFIAQAGDAVKIAGPLLDEAGEPVGSLFLLDLADRAAVEAFADNDPYYRAGVFKARDIKPFKLVVNGLSTDA